MHLKVIIALFFQVSLFGSSPAQISGDSLPKLQMLTKMDKKDSTLIDSSRKITADSAKIMLPSVRTVIITDSIPIEIVPVCAADSITIFVRHSSKQVDTLGTILKPPYRAVWNCKSIPDQDQIHLQIGYILFHKSGIKIVSPPLAHRWVLDRNKTISKKRYHSHQKDAPDTSSIDGLIDDWRGVKTAKLGDIGTFKVLWSGTHIFFAAEIIDSSVTYNDLVELHFDLHNDKAEFAGINHRSIRFGPKSRSNCFTVNLTDSGFILADSVNVLLSREMRWGRKILPNGYSIEVSLPISVLSDLQYPGKVIGFDVSVINVDENGKEEKFTSWSGSEISTRYNPSQWGNLVLIQAMYPLRAVVIIGIILFIVIILGIIGFQFYLDRKNNAIAKKELDGYSEFMESIDDTIRNSLSDINLSAATVSYLLSRSREEIEDTIEKEAECSFDQLVNFHKVKVSRKLLRDTNLSLEEIAKKTGFTSEAAFKEFYINSTSSQPEEYRQRKYQEAEEIRKEKEEDSW